MKPQYDVETIRGHHVNVFTRRVMIFRNEGTAVYTRHIVYILIRLHVGSNKHFVKLILERRHVYYVNTDYRLHIINIDDIRLIIVGHG